MKKNICLAILLYILLSITVFLTNKYMKNYELQWSIIFAVEILISVLIIGIKRPFAQEKTFITDKRDDSRIIKKLKIFLYAWMASVVITKLVIGILGEVLFFPWHPDESLRHYLIVYSMVIIGALAEELLFRYLIYGEILSKKLKKWIAIIITSLLFALMHKNFTLFSFFNCFFMGIQLNLLFEFYPSIVLVSGYHLLTNLLTFVF